MRSLAHLLQRKIKLYQWMYEFTQSQCTSCSLSGCACKDSICAHVEKQARTSGNEFAHTGHALRFIGCAGCVVPPHLRETCTIYVCDSAQKSPLFKRKTYERLKRVIALVEWQLMEHEEALRNLARARTSHKIASQIS